jgi:hypothetical protein
MENKKRASNKYLKLDWSNKKALTLSTIVGLVILIFGFLILLFAYSQLSWTGNVDREVCHQSVVYRATLPSFANAKEYVPLKCKTDKICITTGLIGGKCKEFQNTKGVTKVNVKDIEDVEQTVAKEILGCWEIMGEGKVSLFNDWFVQTYGFGGIASSCVICSRIAFDNVSLSKAGIDLDKMNVLNYMMTHKVPNKEISYYVYMTGQGGKMSISDKRQGDVKIDDIIQNGNDYKFEKQDLSLQDYNVGNLDSSNELSVMFMQVAAPKYSDVFTNSVGTLLGGTAGGFLISPKYAGKGVAAVAKSPWFWAVLAVVGIYQYNSVRENQAVTAGYCGDISVGDTSTTGCSVVRTVNYGAEDLSKYCSKIESIP